MRQRRIWRVQETEGSQQGCHMSSKWGVERNEVSRAKVTTSYDSILNGNDKAQNIARFPQNDLRVGYVDRCQRLIKALFPLAFLF